MAQQPVLIGDCPSGKGLADYAVGCVRIFLKQSYIIIVN